MVLFVLRSTNSDAHQCVDMPTQFGSPLYKGFRPHSDASIVSLLRTAGAVIFGMSVLRHRMHLSNHCAGKTTTSEFTVANYGPDTTNPWDPSRTPGGSSAGSAAAVADMQVPISFGTQTGGSVIRPAGFTGVFAMKPTFNGISLEGVKVVSTSLDTAGVFARSMEDLQLLADVFAFRQYGDPRRAFALEQARVAFLKSPMWLKAGPGTVQAMDKAARALEKHGVRVDHIELPPAFGDAEALKLRHKTVMSGDARAAFLVEYRKDKTLLGPEIRSLVENKSNFTLDDFARAVDRYTALRPEFDKLAANYSVLITPSTVDVAPLGLDDMGDPSFNLLWTVSCPGCVHVASSYH